MPVSIAWKFKTMWFWKRYFEFPKKKICQRTNLNLRIPKIPTWDGHGFTRNMKKYSTRSDKMIAREALHHAELTSSLYLVCFSTYYLRRTHLYFYLLFFSMFLSKLGLTINNDKWIKLFMIFVVHNNHKFFNQ